MKITSVQGGPSKVLHIAPRMGQRSVNFPKGGPRYQSEYGLKKVRDDPEEIPYRYTYPKFKPDEQHPSYASDEIMDFRDKSSRYPPARALQRLDRLQKAKEYGIDHQQFNKPVRKRHPLPVVPVRLDHKDKPEKVAYQVGKTGATMERQQFSANEDAVFENEWQLEEDEAVILEPGRIVEVRR